MKASSLSELGFDPNGASSGFFRPVADGPCPPTSHRRRLSKVSVIGAGNVGMAIAETILTRDLADEIALLDALPDKLLDLQNAATFLPHTSLVYDTDIVVTKGSDLAIVTAGARQSPGETRLNLQQRNVALFRKIVRAPAEHSLHVPACSLVEHLDVIAQDVQVGRPWQHFSLISTNTPAQDYSYMVGEHGDSSVAIWSHQMTSNPLPQDGPRKPVERPLDHDGARVAPGRPGEVCIKGVGANVTKGGYRNPEAAVVIVGAGSSGLAVAACLRKKGVPFVVLERDDCIAPLWQKRTYGGLKLHLPKRFCELPHLPFPDHYPEYPTARQYADYLKDYAAKFNIKPEFNSTVLSAHYDETFGRWRVRAADTGVGDVEYICRWLVVATGENARSVVPNIPGLDGFAGEVTHVGDNMSAEAYRGKRVLVVGSGNSGMQVALDLCDHGAHPAVVARDAVHVLPREVLGKHILDIAMLLERWLPVWTVDKMMVLLSRVVLGDLAKLGLRRPAAGPLERKGTRARPPVLDYGVLKRIRAGDIAVVPDVARFGSGQVEFVDGRVLGIDAVVLATGRRSNVPQAEWHGNRNRYPATAFPYGWDGHCGLYAVGFSRRSFGGASTDAVRVAEEIAGAWTKGGEPACDRDRMQGAVVVF